MEGPKLSSYNKCALPESATDEIKVVLMRALNSNVEVKKHRLLFMVGQTRVHVDNVEGLGDFMELEVSIISSVFSFLGCPGFRYAFF